MDARPFIKMHGLGNDFVVVDARQQPLSLDESQARRIADRRQGVGCDQLIVIEPARDGGDAFMRIRNADGGEVAACGNATRCVASLLMAESGQDRAVVETAAGPLYASQGGDGLVSVDMGPARLDWRELPLAREMDTLALPLVLENLREPVAVSVGNPHAVFFVPEIEAVDLPRLGPILEHDTLFPERANINVAQILDRQTIRLRVWERGVGITQACGTGACATMVAAARRGLVGDQAEVRLDGGSLWISWRLGESIIMTGPVATAFTGWLDAHLLGGEQPGSGA